MASLSPATQFRRIARSKPLPDKDSTIPMTSAPPLRRRHDRIILAGLIGNVMEWYDFAVYGYFAVVIGKLFFPADDPAASLIASFGAFAAGFIVRPVGGLLFGRIGDRLGRQQALTWSVMAMAVPTVLMAFLPTHASAGIAAPVAIVLLRIVQGLSVGGEFTNSLVFLVENAPGERRAFTAVWGSWGASAGILLGSGAGDLLTHVLSEEQVLNWGWRLPFLAGGLVALTGYWLRQGLEPELPNAEHASPVRAVFARHKGAMLRVALLNLGFGVGFYAAFIYAVSYIKNIDHLPDATVFNLNTWAMALLLVLLPVAAWASDRFGRKPVLAAGFGLLALGAIPLFHLIHTADPPTIFLGEAGFALTIGLISGGIVATNVELVPAEVRCTGLAFAYNAAVGCFGGSTPLIAAWLIDRTGNPLTPAYWIAATATVSLITLVAFVREFHFHMPR
ncbi:major facilitator family transporter [Methylococcus capsulatus str. Bath]|uniref:Major facilitator family transporter n=3 Tax=Methylococcus capsulatus TaxID=414 RepID=Q608H0_METCA|nr:major facilitator family transporter [Methylococcus capsulatus str. Bath]